MHTVLDLLTLVATAWVIYTLRVTLRDSYQNEQDTIQTYYVVRTSAACACAAESPMRMAQCVPRWQQSGEPRPCRPRATRPTLSLLRGVQVIPCAVLAAIAHPGTNHPIVFRVRPRPRDLRQTVVSQGRRSVPGLHHRAYSSAATLAFLPYWRPDAAPRVHRRPDSTPPQSI